jgi:hypothetical protein
MQRTFGGAWTIALYLPFVFSESVSKVVKSPEMSASQR